MNGIDNTDFSNLISMEGSFTCQRSATTHTGT